MGIFSIQKDFINGYKVRIAANSTYDKYIKYYNETHNEEVLPVLAFYTLSNSPKEDFGDYDRTFKLQCRLIMSATDTDDYYDVLETLYEDIKEYTDETMGTYAACGNPTFTILWEDSNTIKAADLEVSIFYITQ